MLSIVKSDSNDSIRVVNGVIKSLTSPGTYKSVVPISGDFLDILIGNDTVLSCTGLRKYLNYLGLDNLSRVKITPTNNITISRSYGNYIIEVFKSTIGEEVKGASVFRGNLLTSIENYQTLNTDQLVAAVKFLGIFLDREIQQFNDLLPLIRTNAYRKVCISPSTDFCDSLNLNDYGSSINTDSDLVEINIMGETLEGNLFSRPHLISFTPGITQSEYCNIGISDKILYLIPTTEVKYQYISTAYLHLIRIS